MKDEWDQYQHHKNRRGNKGKKKEQAGLDIAHWILIRMHE
jgi:hypothetical protein